MRATGHSVCNSLARIGAFMSPYFVYSSYSLATIGTTLALVNFIAAATAYFLLTETLGLKLDDESVAGTPRNASTVALAHSTSVNSTQYRIVSMASLSSINSSSLLDDSTHTKYRNLYQDELDRDAPDF